MEVAKGLYRHFKGNLYRVINTATHTETYERFVVYYNVTDPDDYFARPISNFLETVLLDNKEVPRFTREVEDNERDSNLQES